MTKHRVLVTGADGFIGRYLVPALKEAGHQVFPYDKETGDVVKGFTPEPFDILIHLAANTSSKAALEDPRMDFEANVVGTFNMLELARQHGAGFIYPSTHKVKKNFRGSRGPYGMSKFTGESYVIEWAKTYGMSVIVNRFGNLYGVGKDGAGSQFWVNLFVAKTTKGEPVEIWGDGENVRDLLYITDVVKLLVDEVDCFELYKRPVVIPAGGGQQNAVSVNEILDFIDCDNRVYKDPLPGDSKKLITRNALVKGIHGWEPKVWWQEGVNQLIAFYEDRA